MEVLNKSLINSWKNLREKPTSPERSPGAILNKFLGEYRDVTKTVQETLNEVLEEPIGLLSRGTLEGTSEGILE